MDEKSRQRLIRKLKERIPQENIFTDEPMSKHTTFKAGGVADLFVEIMSKDELSGAVGALSSEGFTFSESGFYIIGNGSNLLVSDKGLRKPVLHISKEFSKINSDSETLICEAGCTLAAIAKYALDNSLTGFEFAAGIPGSLGGAIVMNAGAYDGEMKQVVESVRLMTDTGEIVEKSAAEMRFSYRHSILKEESFIVLGAKICLSRGNHDDIKARMNDLAFRRRDKQPLEYPSAGSTFKRPEGYFAAKLIQDAGLRGFSVGDAQVSEKHCGFIVNRGNATASQIYALIKEVQRRVRESSGVDLETEVICLGEFE